MEKECQQRMQEITSKFKECRKAISAMGDETRQLILIALLESDFNGIRVGEITKKHIFLVLLYLIILRY
ncbi:hypothetical protein PCZ31_3487 [Clostridioides difficile]|nr:hypothetical protein PCZ31_3487 [Clostridioides difficile]